MSRLFLLLAVLSMLMGMSDAAGLFLVLSLGSAGGWLLLGPKGHWL